MTTPIRIVSSPRESQVRTDPRLVYSPAPIRGTRYTVRSEPPKSDDKK